MSLAALTWAKRQTAGGVAAKAVLMALADYADERGTCWPSQDLIARETELTDRSVRDQLGKLEAAGLISRENRRRRDGTQASDRFILAMDGRNDVPAVRKDVPVSATDVGIAIPEGRSGSARDRRNDVPQPPEGRSALTTFEPPQEEPPQSFAPDGARRLTPQQHAMAALVAETLEAHRAPPPTPPAPPADTEADPDAQAWALAVSLLTKRAGLSERQSRAFFGGLLKRHACRASELLVPLIHAEDAGTPDLQPYLTAAAQNLRTPRLIHDRCRTGPGQSPNRRAEGREVWADLAAEEAAARAGGYGGP